MKNSKRSYHFALISLVLMSVFLSLSLIERTAANSAMDDVTGFLITLFFITVIGGFMYALFSLREPNSWRKILGLVVNIGLFLMLALNVYRNIGMF